MRSNRWYQPTHRALRQWQVIAKLNWSGNISRAESLRYSADFYSFLIADLQSAAAHTLQTAQNGSRSCRMQCGNTAEYNPAQRDILPISMVPATNPLGERFC